MALNYNDKNVSAVTYNGKPVNTLIYNGNIVFTGSIFFSVDVKVNEFWGGAGGWKYNVSVKNGKFTDTINKVEGFTSATMYLIAKASSTNWGDTLGSIDTSKTTFSEMSTTFPDGSSALTQKDSVSLYFSTTNTYEGMITNFNLVGAVPKDNAWHTVTHAYKKK